MSEVAILRFDVNVMRFPKNPDQNYRNPTPKEEAMMSNWRCTYGAGGPAEERVDMVTVQGGYRVLKLVKDEVTGEEQMVYALDPEGNIYDSANEPTFYVWVHSLTFDRSGKPFIYLAVDSFRYAGDEIDVIDQANDLWDYNDIMGFPNPPRDDEEEYEKEHQIEQEARDVEQVDLVVAEEADDAAAKTVTAYSFGGGSLLLTVDSDNKVENDYESTSIYCVAFLAGKVTLITSSSPSNDGGKEQKVQIDVSMGKRLFGGEEVFLFLAFTNGSEKLVVGSAAQEMDEISLQIYSISHPLFTSFLDEVLCLVSQTLASTPTDAELAVATNGNSYPSYFLNDFK